MPAAAAYVIEFNRISGHSQLVRIAVLAERSFFLCFYNVIANSAMAAFGQTFFGTSRFYGFVNNDSMSAKR